MNWAVAGVTVEPIGANGAEVAPGGAIEPGDATGNEDEIEAVGDGPGPTAESEIGGVIVIPVCDALEGPFVADSAEAAADNETISETSMTWPTRTDQRGMLCPPSQCSCRRSDMCSQ